MQASPIQQPSSNLKAQTYPYHYSAQVVWDFQKKLGRASHFVAKKLGIEDDDFTDFLIKTFQERNARWNVLREVIKYIDKYNLYEELVNLDRHDFVKYLTCVKTLVEDDLIDVMNLQKFG